MIESSLSRCYGILYIPKYLDFLGYGPVVEEPEFIDLNFTNIENEEGICRYIEDVLNINHYEVYWTFLDFDHFVEIHKQS